MTRRHASALLPGSLLVLLLVGGCSWFASRGTMPPPGPNGVVDPSLVPEFVAYAGQADHVIGWVPKECLGLDRPPTDGCPVYAEDLSTVLGHDVAGKGFVQVGVDPATVPKIPVQVAPSVGAPAGGSKSLTLYVRNGTTGTAWFTETLLGAPTGGQGYINGLGVGCLEVAAGSQLVMIDGPPTDAGVRTLRVVYQALQANETPTLWVDIGADGKVTQGRGVPPWWSGPPQAC